MTPVEFCYWLQGSFELGKITSFDEEQTKILKNHLALVFHHSIDDPDPTGELQAIHDGLEAFGGPLASPAYLETSHLKPSVPPDERYRC